MAPSWCLSFGAPFRADLSVRTVPGHARDSISTSRKECRTRPNICRSERAAARGLPHGRSGQRPGAPGESSLASPTEATRTSAASSCTGSCTAPLSKARSPPWRPQCQHRWWWQAQRFALLPVVLLHQRLSWSTSLPQQFMHGVALRALNLFGTITMRFTT